MCTMSHGFLSQCNRSLNESSFMSIFRVHVEQSSNSGGLDLVFRSIAAEDGGNYSCQAEIDGRHERRDFELKVIGS